MGNTKGEIVGIGTYTSPVLYHTNPEVSSMYIVSENLDIQDLDIETGEIEFIPNPYYPDFSIFAGRSGSFSNSMKILDSNSAVLTRCATHE